MKSISSSIVLLAGTIMVTGGSFVPHNDTAVFVQVVGGLLGIAGLAGWFAAWRSDTAKHGD